MVRTRDSSRIGMLARGRRWKASELTWPLSGPSPVSSSDGLRFAHSLLQVDDGCRETLTPPKTSHVSSFSSEDGALVQLSRLTGYTIGLSALGAASQAVSTPEIRWTEPRRASVRLPWPGCIFLSDSQWRTGPDAPPTPPHSCPGTQDVPVVRSSRLLIFFLLLDLWRLCCLLKKTCSQGE